MNKEMVDRIEGYKNKKSFYDRLCELGKMMFLWGSGWTAGTSYFVGHEEINKDYKSIIALGIMLTCVGAIIGLEYSIKRDRVERIIGDLEEKLEEEDLYDLWPLMARNWD